MQCQEDNFNVLLKSKNIKCGNTLKKDSGCISIEVPLSKGEFSKNITLATKLFEDTSDINISKSKSTSLTFMDTTTVCADEDNFISNYYFNNCDNNI